MCLESVTWAGFGIVSFLMGVGIHTDLKSMLSAQSRVAYMVSSPPLGAQLWKLQRDPTRRSVCRNLRTRNPRVGDVRRPNQRSPGIPRECKREAFAGLWLARTCMRYSQLAPVSRALMPQFDCPPHLKRRHVFLARVA